MPDVRVLIVAEDPLVRGGLAALLGERALVVVSGQASPEEDVTRSAEIYQADVLLWDFANGPTPAMDRLTQSAESLPPVLALVADVASAPQAWGAGARGVLMRDAPAARIAAGLTALAEGVSVLDAEVAEAVARRAPPSTGGIDPLTPRELDVLRLLAEGLPNKGIAERLDVSENTVKFHVNAILGKLGAQSRTEAVTRATRMGLVPL